MNKEFLKINISKYNKGKLLKAPFIMIVCVIILVVSGVLYEATKNEESKTFLIRFALSITSG